jgi:hypothetical protein
MTHGKSGWVCDPQKCPKRVPENSISYQVEKRYLTTATIMFLTSAKEDQSPEEFSEIFASRLEELTEEIISFEMEVLPLNGGFIGHEIIGSELVPKKTSKHRFRRQILDEWDNLCAYCGQPGDTLDHILARSKGGSMSVVNNLVCCCKFCNGSKSDQPMLEWFRDQPFWNQEREDCIKYWMEHGTLDET